MMRSTWRWLVLPALFLSIAYPLKTAASATLPPEYDWLLKNVCADASNTLAAVDPYGGCPPGTTERDIQVGERLPYLNHDQPQPGRPDGFQRRDNYPLLDKSGNPLAVGAMDFGYDRPYGTFEAGDGDGYDLLTSRNGWVSASGTRDGGGYSQTFYGSGCTPYNGWIFFPTTFLQSLTAGSSGQAPTTLTDDYWEESSQNWPGTCNSFTHFDSSTITSWQFKPGFAFGGLNGAPVKTMDTIVSTHGYSNSPTFITSGALEVFYFTKQYGVTRWEAWAPTAQNRPPQQTPTCSGPNVMTYNGIPFTLVDCRDWSMTIVGAASESVPTWPVPDTNLLANFHFTGSTNSWTKSGSKTIATALRSTTPDDTRFGPGVSYLSLGCGGSICQPSQRIYQDIPIANIKAGLLYDFAISAVSHGATPGTVSVTLDQVNNRGSVLHSDSFTVSVPAAFRSYTDANSVYLAATFEAATTTAPITIQSGATALRFGITPQTPSMTFDIVDAWVMPRNAQ
jgi:hypothetical protein